MRLLSLTDSMTGAEIVVVAQNVFAITEGVNEYTQQKETRIYGAGDDFVGVKEPKQEVIDELSKA